MAVYTFSALADGQAVAFNPSADLLNFDETGISAANLGFSIEGGNLRLTVSSGSTEVGKSVLLENTSPLQLATSNVSFANGSALLFGDNSAGTANDNASNTLFGGNGQDLLQGFGGNDSLNGGASSDWLNGGAGNDTLDGAGGQDHLAFSDFGTANADLVFGFATDWDDIRLDLAAFTALGTSAGRFSAGDVRFYSAAGATSGHDADDRIIFNTSTGQLFYDADGSGSGASQLVATISGAGRTVVASDIYLFGTPPASGGNVINGTAGNDTLTGTPGNDTINGLGGNDSLSGLAGDDSLSGGDGNDTLDGGDGTDTLDGGLGDDTYDFNGSEGPGVIADAGGIDTAVVTDTDAITIWELDPALENLTIVSPAFFIAGTGNDSDNVIRNENTASEGYIDGGDGNDTLIGGPYFLFQAGSGDYGHDFVDGAGDHGTLIVGSDSAATVDFRSGTVVGGGTGGTGAIDFINVTAAGGGRFNDTFIASDAGDFAKGDAGNDTFVGGAGADTFIDDEQVIYDGADVGGVDSGNDSLSGGGGDDLLVINRGNDTVDGGAGNDTISINIGGWFASGGYTFDDVLDGGAGNDTLWINQLSAVDVDLGAGTLSGGGDGGSGSATLANIENFEVSRFAGFSNRLVGSVASNALVGGADADTLNGAGGNDTLTGYDGADHFLFDQVGAANADHVTDFASGTDEIHLDGTIMTALGASGNFSAGDARFFAAAGASAGHDADDRVVYDTSSGNLWYDADGSGAGAAQLVAVLDGPASLTASDIFVDNGTSPGTIDGTAGNDSLVGTAGNDTINGFGGDDTLVGLGGNDALNGGDGNDSLDGTSGEDPQADTLSGGLGDDTYMVGANDVIASDAGGVDTVQTLDTDWTLGAGLENLILHQTARFDGSNGTGNELDNLIDASTLDHAGTLSGLGGNDTIFSAQNGGHLFGGAGNDELHGQKASFSGGAGNDTLVGDGSDLLLFDVAPGSANADVIVGGAEFVQLDGNAYSAIGPSGQFTADDPRFFSSAGASAGYDADDRVVYDTSSGNLWYDADGSGAGAAQLIATFQGAPAFSAGFISVVNGQSGTINGTAGNDSLVGTAGNDTINGLGGDDTLVGLGGDDVLDGGPGNDMLDGGAGNDTFILMTPSAGDAITDSSGIDTIVTDANGFSLAGQPAIENLTLVGSANINGFGNASANVLTGNAGNNTFWAGDGNDTLNGGAGNDYLGGDSGSDWLDGQQGNDTLDGGGGQDHFAFTRFGAADADTAANFSSGWDDIQLDIAAFSALGSTGRFASGDARFYAAAGATGGHDADDRVVYNTSTGQLFYDADGSGGGAAQVFGTVNGAGTVLASDINVFGTASVPPNAITGTAGDDSLTGTAGNDSMSGLGGNDTLNGGGGNDTLDGGAGNDSLVGSDGQDSFVGGDGNDTLYGWNASFGSTEGVAETLDGGVGNDRFYVDNAGDVLLDSGGTDTVVAKNIGWTLAAGFENLVLNNGEVETTRSGIGNSLDNVLDGRSGQGVTTGGDGWSVHLEGLGGNDTLLGSVRADTLIGGDGNDSLAGDQGPDSLDGGSGNDTLAGGFGDDMLSGSTGNDLLSGGDDSDIFAFSASPGSANADTLTDFVTATDTLQLDGTVYANSGPSGTFAAGDGRFYSAAGASAGHDADDRVVYDTASGNLWYDSDGNGSASAQLIATLSGAPTLAATDITVVNGGTSMPGTINGTAGNDSLVGTAGNDTINGLGGNDTLVGLSGDDVLDGGPDNDTLDGGAGNDTFILMTPSSGDAITDSSGIDTIVTDANGLSLSPLPAIENLTLVGSANINGFGNAAANVLTGNSGNNTFWAGDANDTLNGGAGNDYLGGDNGADRLDGQQGNDTLDGGGGQDHFVFDQAGTANADTVVNFSSDWDDLQLAASAFNALGSAGQFTANDGRFFEAAGASAGHDADDRLVYNTSTGALYYDDDGSGAHAAQLVATLQGAPTLAAADIHVI